MRQGVSVPTVNTLLLIRDHQAGVTSSTITTSGQRRGLQQSRLWSTEVGNMLTETKAPPACTTALASGLYRQAPVRTLSNPIGVPSGK